MLETTVDVTCPHCWETIQLFVDLSIAEQEYVEDCSVCCRPMTVAIRCADGELESAEVTALE
jgi:Cysteine-rich CPXCG